MVDKARNFFTSKDSVQREITLNLHIKQVHIPVTEQTHLMVVWQRGNKKAKTK